MNDNFTIKHIFETFSSVSEIRVIKNETELNGMNEALKLESAALICFYALLKEKLTRKSEDIYEHQCPALLDKIRKEIAQENF